MCRLIKEPGSIRTLATGNDFSRGLQATIRESLCHTAVGKVIYESCRLRFGLMYDLRSLVSEDRRFRVFGPEGCAG